jgi:hypothetical protein
LGEQLVRSGSRGLSATDRAEAAIVSTHIVTPGIGNVAANVLGTGNTVVAGPGPFAVAGVAVSSNNNGIGTNPPPVTQVGTGLHVIP